ncbi:hypothetical protein NDU88_001332 [Pleurodeles waltl]|uniref:Uncharacterized protein n=1 Tax=Pleurodeles waltl TaxID=8319 RepID=A0AAV7RA04_PLEWA|nr:hypothetical protein NDU88_001332 [Pleurodeles waltl]
MASATIGLGKRRCMTSKDCLASHTLRTVGMAVRPPSPLHMRNLNYLRQSPLCLLYVRHAQRARARSVLSTAGARARRT